MSKRMIVLAVLGILGGGALAYLLTALPGGPQQNSGVVTTTGKALIGGPFSLTDHTGKRVTEKDFLGRPMLVFFGFTHCPDICPSGLQVISAAIDKIGAKADELVPVFITLDPARDTPEKLSEYVKSFHPRIVGLTGSAEDVAAAAKTYRVFYQKIDDEKNPGAYTIDHAAIIYLMGKDGAFVSLVPHTTNVDQVAAVIEKALP
ncbi:MAG: SCO family protein [Hyphomicrobium sp.]